MTDTRTRIILQVYERAHRAVRRSQDLHTRSQRLEEFRTAYELLPAPLRAWSWVVTSVERGT